MSREGWGRGGGLIFRGTREGFSLQVRVLAALGGSSYSNALLCPSGDADWSLALGASERKQERTRERAREELKRGGPVSSEQGATSPLMASADPHT